MTRLSRSMMWLYSQLLRLYPTRFQNEFADEMRAVFEQSVQESGDSLSLIGLVVGELRDLPFNLVREHLRARRKTALSEYGEVILMNPVQSRSLFRTCVTASLLMFSLYCLIVIRPVLALNLDAQAIQAVENRELNLYYYIAEGFFQYRPVAPEDVGTLRSFEQRDTIHAVVEALVAKFMLIGAPIGAVLLGSILIFHLGENWHYMRRWQRIIGSASMVANILLIVFLFLPTGHLVLRWWDMPL